MAEQNSIPARPGSQRRLIAAGIKRGTGPLAVQFLSPADRAAYIRRPVRAA